MTATAQRTQQTAPAPAPVPVANTPAPAPPVYGPPVVRLGPTPVSSLPISIRPMAAGGSPISATTRAPIERSLAVDLSTVRVHSSPEANAGAARLGAPAFTIGSHIFMGAGQSSSDLGVMAHEAAHTVQQRGSDTVQTYTGSLTDNVYEREAQTAATAVQAGQPATIAAQTRGLVPQGLFGLPSLSEAIQSARNWFAERVDSIPGYNLLTVIIGHDPVRGRPVARTAVNLIRGVCGLIPGGAEKFDQLQQSGVIQRAYDWVMSEIARLGITLELFTNAFRQFIDSVHITDLIRPISLLQRVINIFTEPIRRITTFAINAVLKLAEFIFEGVLGPTGAQILAILKRAAGAFQTIIRDPIRFVMNLVNAVKGGIQRFAANIGQHLINGLVGWLFGALQGAGLQLPQRWDARGVISLVLQILGLTYQRIRPRLVRLIGERPVAFLEGTFNFLMTIVRGGLGAAWQKLLEFAGNLGDMVMQGIRDFVTQTIVQQAIIRVVSLFNPAGAIIQAILAIYNTIQWLIQRMQQILALVNSVVESIANIAEGNLGGAIAYIEQSMARALPVIISFLAGLLGLGRISDRIRAVIQRIQATVDRAVDAVLNFVVRAARGLLARMTGGGDGVSAQDPQARLRMAVQAVRGAFARFAGRRTGRFILAPILQGIRLRYRLRTLEAAPKGQQWAVRAEINPVLVETTDALVFDNQVEAAVVFSHLATEVEREYFDPARAPHSLVRRLQVGGGVQMQGYSSTEVIQARQMVSQQAAQETGGQAMPRGRVSEYVGGTSVSYMRNPGREQPYNVFVNSLGEYGLGRPRNILVYIEQLKSAQMLDSAISRLIQQSSISGTEVTPQMLTTNGHQGPPNRLQIHANFLTRLTRLLFQVEPLRFLRRGFTEQAQGLLSQPVALTTAMGQQLVQEQAQVPATPIIGGRTQTVGMQQVLDANAPLGPAAQRPLRAAAPGAGPQRIAGSQVRIGMIIEDVRHAWSNWKLQTDQTIQRRIRQASPNIDPRTLSLVPTRSAMTRTLEAYYGESIRRIW